MLMLMPSWRRRPAVRRSLPRDPATSTYQVRWADLSSPAPPAWQPHLLPIALTRRPETVGEVWHAGRWYIHEEVSARSRRSHNTIQIDASRPEPSSADASPSLTMMGARAAGMPGMNPGMMGAPLSRPTSSYSAWGQPMMAWGQQAPPGSPYAVPGWGALPPPPPPPPGSAYGGMSVGGPPSVGGMSRPNTAGRFSRQVGEQPCRCCVHNLGNGGSVLRAR
jgi:hypothetical protein